MSFFIFAARAASLVSAFVLGLACTPVLAQFGEPAADPQLLEAAVPGFSEAHALDFELSAGGRPHFVWLRQGEGWQTLMRRYHRPPMSPGLLIEDPVTWDIGGPPLIAMGSASEAASTVIYPDLAGTLQLLRYSASGDADGPGPRALTEVSGPILNPALATDAQGTLSALVWASPEADGFAVYALGIAPWGSVGAPVRLGAAASLEAPQPRLASVMSDRFVVTWAQVDPATPFLRSVLIQPFDVWSGALDAAREVAVSAEADLGAPDIAGGSWGRSFLAYSTREAVRLQSFDSGLNSTGDYSVHAFPLHWPPHAPRPVRVSAGIGDRIALAWAGQDPYSWPELSWIESLLADAWGTALGPVSRAHESPGVALELNALASDADGDFWLGWTEGAAADQSRSLISRVMRGESFVDLQIEADPPYGPTPPGFITPLLIRLHNYERNSSGDGVGSASGIEFRVDGLDGGAFVLELFPSEFECSQDAQQLRCRYHGELAANGVMVIWAALQTPVTAAPLALQLSVSGHQTDYIPANNQIQLSIPRPDTEPDSFGFDSALGVEPGSRLETDSLYIGGFDTETSVQVAGGEYSISGSAWRTGEGRIGPNDAVRVRHFAASGFEQSVVTTLTVGGVSGSFSSTTRPADGTPDAPQFGVLTGVPTGLEQTSAEVSLVGFDIPVALSITAGSYSLNGAAFSTAATHVQPGDRLRLRHVSAAAPNTSVSTQLSVGGQLANFSTSTGSVDTTPNAFSFNDVSNARRNRNTVSNTLTLGGFNAAVPISISGGQYSRNGGAWTAAPGNVSPGQTLRLRLTSSASPNTTTSATVTVGGISDVWSVTTGN